MVDRPPVVTPASLADRWLADYRAAAQPGDVVDGAPAWTAAFSELAAVAGGDLAHARERVARHAADIGTGFRVVGEAAKRAWPVSPVPLLLDADEWRGIAAGVAQRAALLELILADLYGPARLVADGHIPAALVAGSPYYLRSMTGLMPPGGHQFHHLAFDLARGPDGAWRVLADHLRAPVGAGYALENRLAVGRTLGGLQARINVQRYAPFFAALRAGLAAGCRRADPRIALLTPGRFAPSHAEQAHLARYLGFLLVEGADLAVLDDKLYVRTIGGLKRVDALWRRVDPRLLDPLAFDSHSRIGVPGLIDAYAAGEVVIANAPGAGVLEAPAWSAFLPRLAQVLTGEPLTLPTIATWWCGQAHARAAVEDRLDRLLIAPAFGVRPLGLPEGAVAGASLTPGARAALLADLAKRPQDYVGQEQVRLSTMPVVVGGALVPRPFTLRVFAARDGDGAWQVLPGGLARIGDAPDTRAAVMGDGVWSADMWVHGREAVKPTSLLPAPDSLQIRRNPGTLPSRVADNLYWLGRYLERGEALLGVTRVMLGTSIDADAGGALAPDTARKLVGLIVAGGTAPPPRSFAPADLTAFARTAIEAPDQHSVVAINGLARAIGEGARDRLSADMVRLLEAPLPRHPGLLDRAAALQRRYAALAGLSAEHMGRTAAWRFLDLGRRVERALGCGRAVRAFGLAGASLDDLSTLLDLSDAQIGYRQRYPTGIARVPVVDLVALDPANPRSLAYQTERIRTQLRALPVLGDDGLAEPQQAAARAVDSAVATADAATLDAAALFGVEQKLYELSDLVARRYFLQGAEPLRASGLTLA